MPVGANFAGPLGADGTILSLGLAVEKLVGVMPLPPPPGCIGCKANVTIQDVRVPPGNAEYPLDTTAVTGRVPQHSFACGDADDRAPVSLSCSPAPACSGAAAAALPGVSERASLMQMPGWWHSALLAFQLGF